MRVLVTGAAGFIGRHVSAALYKAGHHVIGLDTSRLWHLACAEWITADITQPLPKLDSLDAVIHLAAVSHPRDCDNDPAKAFTINVLGTQNVLKLALESGAKKVVFASSAHVYSIPPLYSPSDEVHPLRLHNTYTTSKILGEELCRLYFENHGLSYTTLRLFNAYGPGQQLGYFIPDQIEKAKTGKIHLQGSNVTKDWIYVTDVADAFVKALTSDFVGAINIGTSIETDLGAIAQIIAKAYEVELDTHPVAVPTRMCADSRRAERILGWKPTKSIWEGLDAVLDAAKASPIPA